MLQIDSDKWLALTDLERDVIQFVNEHLSEIPEMSIIDLAQETFTSPATVSRAIRKCGINGIAELRYKISTQMDGGGDTTIVNTIFQKFIMECSKTIENIRVSTILKVTNAIKEAPRIFIVARGTTALIGEDFVLQLQLLGYSAFLLKDSEILKKADRLFREKDLIIILSIKFSTPELLIAARAAKGKGGRVVSCCCLVTPEIYDVSDMIITGYSDNADIIEGFDIITRLPLQIIVRALIEYLTI